MAERGVRRGATATRKAVLVNQENDENTYYLRNKTAAKAGAAASSRAALKEAAMPPAKEAAPAKTQKRSALGDLSNIHPQQVSQKEKALKEDVKPSAVAEAKVRPATRSAAATVIAETKQSAPMVESRQVRQVQPPAPAPVSAPIEIEMEDAVDDYEDDEEYRDEEEQEEEEDYENSEMEVAENTYEEAPAEWDDLDVDDIGDPLMVAEYVVEIFDYLRVLELKTLPRADYMTMQKGLQWKQRAILIDWLVEVHWKFRLLPETLFLAVNILDRFLSKRVVLLQKLQLVGIASMLIASKFEEGLSPTIESFVYMADGGYQHSEILTMERQILYALDFNLSYPSPLNFLRRASKAENYDIQTRTLAKYFMEITLLNHEFLPVPPSLLSAASLWLSRAMLARGSWDANLSHYSGYSQAQLRSTADKILAFAASFERTEKFIYKLSKPGELQAIPKKYQSSKFMKASIFVKDYVTKQGF